MGKSITQAQRQQINDYLYGYLNFKKLLRLERYEKEYLGGRESDDTAMFSELPFARAKMFEVRHFILGLANSDEKLFLYYYYVKGESMSRCAELLSCAERSVYRIKGRALEMAYEKLYGSREDNREDSREGE